MNRAKAQKKNASVGSGPSKSAGTKMAKAATSMASKKPAVKGTKKRDY